MKSLRRSQGFESIWVPCRMRDCDQSDGSQGKKTGIGGKEGLVWAKLSLSPMDMQSARGAEQVLGSMGLQERSAPQVLYIEMII